MSAFAYDQCSEDLKLYETVKSGQLHALYEMNASELNRYHSSLLFANIDRRSPALFSGQKPKHERKNVQPLLDEYETFKTARPLFHADGEHKIDTYVVSEFDEITVKTMKLLSTPFILFHDGENSYVKLNVSGSTFPELLRLKVDGQIFSLPRKKTTLMNAARQSEELFMIPVALKKTLKGASKIMYQYSYIRCFSNAFSDEATCSEPYYHEGHVCSVDLERLKIFCSL